VRICAVPGVASPLLTFLDRAIGSESPTLISIEGHGSISVYPRQRTYTTDIHDWVSVPFLGDVPVKSSPCVWGTPSEGGMPVSELQWLAAYHHACQALANGARPRGLVKLLYWPDLAGLPDVFTTPVVRICALLWRKPTASTLVARVLGAEPAQTEALLHVMEGFGHLEIATGFGERMDDDGGAAATAVPEGAGAPQEATVIGKLWRRLMGR
jgi:hypothetical protein